ncbi:MAG: hydantoinase B/oxoprolinase family protein, partial [Bauldia sp.]|nr:hydantoinase B/oxoprolinase family protein [Bauldia sp.]
IEEVEMNYPIRIARYGIVDDSGGNGRHRGGLGVRRDFEFPDADCIFTILSDGRKFAPWGLSGGHDAACARFVLDPDGEARDLPSKITITVPKGGRVSVRTPGGGGFGDPRERSPDAVREDVRNRYISEETARSVYGLKA